MENPLNMFLCPGRPVFRSAFGDGVVMGPWTKKGDQLNMQILGTDDETGFTWPDDLPGPNVKGFQPMVHADAENPGEFTLQRIIPHPDAEEGGRVLYLEVTKDDPDFQGNSRSNYIIDDPIPPQLYMKYRMWLPPNLTEILNAGGRNYNWISLWETKNAPGEGDPDEHNQSYRYNTGLIWKKSIGKLVWHCQGQVMPGHEEYQETDWEHVNQHAPVPLGEWFEFGVFYRQSPDRDVGRFFVHVNDFGVFDVKNRTMTTGRGNKLNLFKLYTNNSHLEAHGLKVYSMFDWVELYGVDCGGS
jgi:hypothetical protein